MEARCTHFECNWEGPYSILKKHQRNCPYKPKREMPNVKDLELVEIDDPHTDSQEFAIEVMHIPDSQEI